MAVERAERVAELLDEAGATHHRVYRITDREDDDGASWYADWLLEQSELPAVLATTPVRSHLVHAPVQLDIDQTGAGTDEPGPQYDGSRLIDRFATGQGTPAAGGV